MALRPNERYPGQTEEPDARYPWGSARNQAVPGDGTGYPWEKDVPNDIMGLLQSLLVESGIEPSGAPDEVGASQYLQALGLIMDERARHLASMNWEPVSIGNAAGSLTDDPLLGRQGVVVVPYSAGSLYKQEAIYLWGGTRVYRSFDARVWEDRGVHGVPGSASSVRGMAAGLMSDGVTTALVMWSGSSGGQIRSTNSDGSVWGNSGTLPVSFDASRSFGGAFRGRFFISGKGRIYFSDDLSLNEEWSSILVPGWTGAPPNDAACFAAGPSDVGCAFGINGGPGLVHSADGDTWASAPLPSGAFHGVNALTWSASHNRWIALSGTVGAKLFTAPAGFGSWTEYAVPVGWSSVRAVTSLGKSVVVAANDALWISRDLEDWSIIPDVTLTPNSSFPSQWEYLVTVNGRMWAGRRHRLSSLMVTEQSRTLRFPGSDPLAVGVSAGASS